MNGELRKRINAIRERINIRLYDSRDSAIRNLRTAGIIISLLAIASLIYYHGFAPDPAGHAVVEYIIKFSIGFYLFKYMMEFIYSFSPIEHLKKTRWEGLLMLFLFINIVSINFFGTEIVQFIGQSFGIQSFENLFILFIQFYFLLIVFLELGRSETILPLGNLSPQALLALSFVFLILVGTGLLLLPEMTVSGNSMPFMDALFTSISASCVTGLIVVDTATYFTFKGQFTIMMLIQLGGLNIISFATMLTLFARQSLGIRQQSLIQSSYSSETLMSGTDLLRKIIRFTFQIELMGALIIFFSWGDKMHFDSIGDRVFQSIFHTISAFNNAGFSIFSNGLMESPIHHSYTLHIVIAILIILGGLGFTTLRDIFTFRAIRERITKPWRSMSIGTKMILYSTTILTVAGAIVFFLLEQNSSLAGEELGTMTVWSFFQSVSSRTAGFNTIDFGMVTMPVLIFFMFLMFVGGAPGSTSGGIKLTTFTLIFLSAWATIRGRKRVEIYKKTIPWYLLNRAFAILLFAVTAITAGIFVLAITDPHLGLENLAFEMISAFSTVGLSTGITADLSPEGRTVIMIAMYIGRIGTLTLAFALSGRKRRSDNYKYPKGNVIVG